MKILSIALMAAIVSAISGCSKVPECSDADSISVVTGIAKDEADKKAWLIKGFFGVEPSEVLGKVEFSLDTIRTSSKEEGVKKSVCEASLVGKAIGSDKKMEAPIRYSVQVTDDGKHIYAEIMDGDIKGVVEGVLDLAIAEAKRDAERAAATTSNAVDSTDIAFPQPASQEASQQTPQEVGQQSVGPIVAGFDCSKASSPAEKLICSDREVASLDLRLTRAYKELLQIYPDKSKLKSEQVTWIREKRNMCSSVDCMKAIYQERVDDLESAGQYLSKPQEFQ